MTKLLPLPHHWLCFWRPINEDQKTGRSSPHRTEKESISNRERILVGVILCSILLLLAFAWAKVYCETVKHKKRESNTHHGRKPRATACRNIRESNCADVGWIIDATKPYSLGVHERAFEFIYEVSKELKYGKNDINMAAFLFNYNAVQKVELDKAYAKTYYEWRKYLTRSGRMQRYRGRRIEEIFNYIFSHSSPLGDGYGHRPGVPITAFLMSDGYLKGYLAKTKVLRRFVKRVRDGGIDLHIIVLETHGRRPNFIKLKQLVPRGSKAFSIKVKSDVHRVAEYIRKRSSCYDWFKLNHIEVCTADSLSNGNINNGVSMYDASMNSAVSNPNGDVNNAMLNSNGNVDNALLNSNGNVDNALLNSVSNGNNAASNPNGDVNNAMLNSNGNVNNAMLNSVSNGNNAAANPNGDVNNAMLNSNGNVDSALLNSVSNGNNAAPNSNGDLNNAMLNSNGNVNNAMLNSVSNGNNAAANPTGDVINAMLNSNGYTNNAASNANVNPNNAASNSNGNLNSAASNSNGNPNNAATNSNGNLNSAGSNSNGNVNNAASNSNGKPVNAASNSNGHPNNAASNSNSNTNNAASNSNGNTNNAASNSNGNTNNAVSNSNGNTNAASNSNGNTNNAALNSNGNTNNAASNSNGNTNNAASNSNGNTNNAASNSKGNTNNAASNSNGNTNNAASNSDGNMNNAGSNSNGNVTNAVSNSKGNPNKEASKSNGNPKNAASNSNGNPNNAGSDSQKNSVASDTNGNRNNAGLISNANMNIGDSSSNGDTSNAGLKPQPSPSAGTLPGLNIIFQSPYGSNGGTMSPALGNNVPLQKTGPAQSQQRNNQVNVGAGPGQPFQPSLGTRTGIAGSVMPVPGLNNVGQGNNLNTGGYVPQPQVGLNQAGTGVNQGMVPVLGGSETNQGIAPVLGGSGSLSDILADADNQEPSSSLGADSGDDKPNVVVVNARPDELTDLVKNVRDGGDVKNILGEIGTHGKMPIADNSHNLISPKIIDRVIQTPDIAQTNQNDVLRVNDKPDELKQDGYELYDENGVIVAYPKFVHSTPPATTTDTTTTTTTTTTTAKPKAVAPLVNTAPVPVPAGNLAPGTQVSPQQSVQGQNNVLADKGNVITLPRLPHFLTSSAARLSDGSVLHRISRVVTGFVTYPASIMGHHTSRDRRESPTIWTEWTTCTASCGGGQQARKRECISPIPEDCSVDRQMRLEFRKCSLTPCQKISHPDSKRFEKELLKTVLNARNKKPWLPNKHLTFGVSRNLTRNGTFGEVKVTSNGKVQSHKYSEKIPVRVTIPPSIDDIDTLLEAGVREQQANGGMGKQMSSYDANGTHVPLDVDVNNNVYAVNDANRPGFPQWTAWSAWSQCSNECGNGVQKRARTCLTNDGDISRRCPGTEPNMRLCVGAEDSCNKQTNLRLALAKRLPVKMQKAVEEHNLVAASITLLFVFTLVMALILAWKLRRVTLERRRYKAEYRRGLGEF